MASWESRRFAFGLCQKVTYFLGDFPSAPSNRVAQSPALCVPGSDLVPIHGQPPHHGSHEIQSRNLPGLLGLNLKGFREIRDDNGLIGIIGGEEVYLVRGPAFTDHEERVLCFWKEGTQVKRPIFLLYSNIWAAEEDRSEVFGKLDSGETFSGDGDRNGPTFPLDDPCVKDGR